MTYNNYTSSGVNGGSPNLIVWTAFTQYGRPRKTITQTYFETAYFNYLQVSLIMSADGIVDIQACNGDPAQADHWFTVPNGSIDTSAAQVFLDWAAYKYARVTVSSGTLDEATLTLGVM